METENRNDSAIGPITHWQHSTSLPFDAIHVSAYVSTFAIPNSRQSRCFDHLALCTIGLVTNLF